MQRGPPTDGREGLARLPGDSSLGSPSPRTVYQDAGKGWGNWSGLLLTPSFPPLPAFRYALTGAVGPAALGALDTAVTGEVAEKRLGPPSSEGRPEEQPLRNPCLARGARHPKCVQRRGTHGGCGSRSVCGRRGAQHRGLFHASPLDGFQRSEPHPHLSRDTSRLPGPGRASPRPDAGVSVP